MLKKRISREQPAFNRMSNNLFIALATASLISENLGEKNVSLSSMLIGILLNEESLARKAVTSMGISVSDIITMLTNKKNIEVVGKVASKELNLSKESADNVDFRLLDRELREATRRERINIISKYMDYRLYLVDGKRQIPKDALNIAKMLGISKEIIEGAQKYIK